MRMREEESEEGGGRSARIANNVAAVTSELSIVRGVRQGKQRNSLKLAGSQGRPRRRDRAEPGRRKAAKEEGPEEMRVVNQRRGQAERAQEC